MDEDKNKIPVAEPADALSSETAEEFGAEAPVGRGALPAGAEAPVIRGDPPPDAEAPIGRGALPADAPSPEKAEEPSSETAEETGAGAPVIRGDPPPAADDGKGKINWKLIVAGAVVMVIVLSITLIVVRFTTEEFRFKQIPQILARFPWYHVAFAFLFLFGYIFCEGRAMAAAGRSIGVKIGPVRSSLFASVELFFSALTPSASGGQPAAAYYMAKKGIPLSKSSTILLNNTMHYMITLIVMSGITLVARFEYVLRLPAGVIWLLIIGIVTNGVGTAACLAFIFAPQLARKALIPCYRFLSRIHVIRDLDGALEKLERSIADYHECQALIRRDPAAQIKIFLWNFAQRVCSFSIAYCVYRGLLACFPPEAVVQGVSYFEFLCVQTVSAMAVNALPLPGATGAAEGVFYILYRHVYQNKNVASYAMFFTRGISFYSIVIICGVASAAYYVHILKKRKGISTQ